MVNMSFLFVGEISSSSKLMSYNSFELTNEFHNADPFGSKSGTV